MIPSLDEMRSVSWAHRFATGLAGKARALLHGLGPKGDHPSRKNMHSDWPDQWHLATLSDCRRCFTEAGGRLRVRMFLCPYCGNKRCPRATDHRLACTGSNERGQPGSDYQ